MRRAAWVIAFAFVGCAGSSAREGAGPEMRATHGVDAVSWLTGCWRYTSPRGTTIDEQWRRAAADTMAGTGVTRRDGRVVESEIMHIVARGDTVIFIAVPSGQTRTEFRAALMSATQAVFENAQHDFPQRISYRIAGDSLHARIDGTMNGSTRAVDFPMARAACTG